MGCNNLFCPSHHHHRRHHHHGHHLKVIAKECSRMQTFACPSTTALPFPQHCKQFDFNQMKKEKTMNSSKEYSLVSVDNTVVLPAKSGAPILISKSEEKKSKQMENKNVKKIPRQELSFQQGAGLPF